MIKSKKDPLPDSEILKEYQSVIRKLQEELYSLKNSQAVQDEIFKTMRESELELQEELVKLIRFPIQTT
jgi:predicted unusual protein kinase regulating ubiquinone biosynthesis (AarF/ABC1/UbiB family)